MPGVRWRARATIALPFLVLLSLSAAASGQAAAEYVRSAAIARADIQLWGQAINTPAGFDRASRASILVYALILHDMQQLPDAELSSLVGIQGGNPATVAQWLAKELDRAQLNYQRASKNCAGDDWTCTGKVTSTDHLLKMAAKANANIPPGLAEWKNNLSIFVRAHVAGQLRLAAQFPKVSSEIDVYGETEWNGDSFADRRFYLSFDDGPTAAHGHTDETLAVLAARNINAVFFVLGEHFKARLDRTDKSSLSALYRNQCVGVHGWKHRSHVDWAQWQDSIIRTQQHVQATLPESVITPLFRPPYGKRRSDSSAFFQAQSMQIALWNLDSQDWNSRVSIDDITNRTITLMLIKRRGMLLFHDTHAKAKLALPIMFDLLGSGVVWGDCHQLANM